MDNVTVLPLDLSQATDSKMIGGANDNGGKDKSDVFFDLMEQHKNADASGNSPRKSGNRAQNAEKQSHKCQTQDDQIADKKNTPNTNNNVTTDSVDAENIEQTIQAPKNVEQPESINDGLSQSQVLHEQVKSSQTLELDVDLERHENTETEAGKQVYAKPEDLLSFISASDKTSTLIANQQQPSELKNLTVASSNIVTKTDVVMDESAKSNRAQAAKDNAEIKLNSDNAIARSVSKDKTVDSIELASKVFTEKNNVTAPAASGGKGEENPENITGLKTKADLTSKAELINKSELINKADLNKYQLRNELSTSQTSLNTSIAQLNDNEEITTELSAQQHRQINSKYIEVNGIPGKIPEKISKVDTPLVSGLQPLTIDEIVNTEESALGSVATNKSTDDLLNPINGGLSDAKASKVTTPNSLSINTTSTNEVASNRPVLDAGANADNSDDNSEVIAFSDKAIKNNEQDKNATQSVTANSIEGKKSTQSTADFMAQNQNQNQKQNRDDSQASKQDINNQAIPLDVADSSKQLEDESLALEKTKPQVATKAAINPLFDVFSQREVSQSVQRAIDVSQSEQSFESVMSTMSADLTQVQKHTSVQQAEVISIMRKDFTEAVKEKVMVMINQKLQQVDIQLDPPEFGNMQVRINMQNEQAVVSFIVQNQQAKEALDQNLDRLKQMMADNGVDVGDASVEQQAKQSSSDGDENENSSNGQGDLAGTDTEQQIDVNSLNMLKASSTGVDYYA